MDKPTPSTAASLQQRRSWHDLAGQYGLEDMLEVSGADSQLGQGVEEQFELYKNEAVPDGRYNICAILIFLMIFLLFFIRNSQISRFGHLLWTLKSPPKNTDTILISF